MSDAIISMIRTYVAVWVSAGGLWLADRGIDLPIDPATIVLTALAVSVYYALVRALESRWPGVGKLLGTAQAPAYGPEVPVKVRIVPDEQSMKLALARINEKVPGAVPRQ